VSVLHYSICAASAHAYPTAPYAASMRVCSTAAWAAPGHCSTAARAAPGHCSTAAWAAPGHCSTADCAAWTDMSFFQQPLLPLKLSALQQPVLYYPSRWLAYSILCCS
jgi:hypothetical protein